MKKAEFSLSRIGFNIFNYLFFVCMVTICIYPLWYIFIYSISNDAQNVVLLPREITFINYEKVFQIEGVFQAFFVSVMRTVVGMLCTVVACTLLGYLFSKQEMPCRSFLYRVLIITMYVSGGLIPTYLVMRGYGLTNSFAVYILPNIINAYYVILIKTYIEQLPSSLEESARIDGASTMVVFTRIIFPLSIPIIATIAVYSSVFQWNSWFDNYIYNFNRADLTTMQYMLYNYLQQVEILIKQIQESPSAGGMDISEILTPKGVRMTVTMVTVLPILFVYPFMQRYFIKGIMLGAVKG